MKAQARKTISRILLAFVLVSVGYAAGKQVTLRRVRTETTEPSAEKARDQVIVYYMHTTFRCVTCSAIEKLALEVVQKNFAEELKSGTVQWQAVNVDENESLAKRYDVAASTVVVVRRVDGKDVSFERLDKVWDLLNKPEEFSAYVSQKIRALLDPEKK